MVNYFRFVGFYMFEVKRLGVGKNGHSNCYGALRVIMTKTEMLRPEEPCT